MIKINLLPIREIKQKLRRRREFFLMIASLLVLAGLLGGTNFVLQSKIDGVKKEVKALEKRKASYTAIQKEINQIKDKQAELQIKIDAIKRLRTDSQLSVRVIDEIANLTPHQRLWINSLRIAGNKLTLSGVGLDNPTIAKFMQDLEASPYFGTANLANSSHSDIGGQKLKSYSLTLQIVSPFKNEQQDEGEKP